MYMIGKNEPQIIIYLLKNKCNDKIYVGQTCQTIEQRWHYGRGYIGCPKINRAIEKYGKENFYYEQIICALNQNDADYFEQFFIKELNSIYNGYNILIGGGNGRTGTLETDEHKKKISDSMKLHIRTEQHNINISKSKLGCKNPMFGKRQSQEIIDKKSENQKGKNNSFYGKTHTAEARAEMSKKKSAENSPFAKLNWEKVNKIRQMIKNNILITEIAKIFNISESTISNIKTYKTWKI